MKKLFENKGIALFMALALLMVVVIFANVILTLMLNQSRITQHQIGRIQAYYAGVAGMNLALDNLRTGDWIFGVDCTPAAPCQVVDAAMIDPLGITTAVQVVDIVFCPTNTICSGVGNLCNPPTADLDFCVDTRITYLTREAFL